MDDDLTRIVASAAAGLVIRLVGTTAWRPIRDRIVKMMGKGNRDHEKTVTTELDNAADELARAERTSLPARARDLESELRGSFRTWLRTDPELVERLGALVAEQNRGASGATVDQVVRVHSGIGLASGQDMTIGSVTNAPGSQLTRSTSWTIRVRRLMGPRQARRSATN
jgi:hypothetical protein